jgi:NADH-quinone oxidoreductase subunit M
MLAFFSWLVFLPLVGAAILLFPWRNDNVSRWITLVASAVTFGLSLTLLTGMFGVEFAPGEPLMQHLAAVDWIDTFNIEYRMGIDGISFPLVMLTTFISLLAMGASWNITKHVRAYCILFLLLETGMIGVFLALDFFLFYVFWEVMLLPMYFLIGIWGGPRREYAAIKFFLYTLFGSVLMLIAILMLYFSSDLRELENNELLAAGVFETAEEAAQWRSTVPSITEDPYAKQHTFNILALQQIGQHTNLFDGFGFTESGKPILFMGQSLQWWAFLLLFIGFIIKVPSVPLHTWLPDAHVEAPTPISMILAGVLLKMGGYGIIRICYPICPAAGYDLSMLVCIIGVVSMLYGAFAALAQRDFKRMVAYSSVSHMGYVVLGFGVWSAFSDYNYNPDYWQMGVNGAMFQMIAHGISSAGMFFMVGVIYDRVHHRNLDEFGGLFGKMPLYSGIAVGIFFAGLGLPGLCGFIGEVLVVLSAWRFSTVLAIIAAATVILTAGYILWALQRVYLGPEYKGPHEEAITPITGREVAIAAPLLVFAVLLGVFPQYFVFDYMAPTVEATVGDLAEWTRRHESRRLAADGNEDADDEADGDATVDVKAPRQGTFQLATERKPLQATAPNAAAANPRDLRQAR